MGRVSGGSAALGLGAFDDNDLYGALDWAAEAQERIERVPVPKRCDGRGFLCDAPSSYFEGQRDELAAPAYIRDGKRFNKQIVIGRAQK